MTGRRLCWTIAEARLGGTRGTGVASGEARTKYGGETRRSKSNAENSTLFPGEPHQLDLRPVGPLARHSDSLQRSLGNADFNNE